MSDKLQLYQAYQAQLEDFWGRRDDRPLYRRSFNIFGRAVELESNHEGVLAAVDFSTPQFSTVPFISQSLPIIKIQVIVRSLQLPEAMQVEEITQQIVYTGQGNWISMQLGRWGYAHADLAAGRASVVIDQALAARPRLFSQAVLNTILLNFCLSNGYAMLHASCLVRDGRVLLLMAPHNTGKSTTALHLLQAGFALVSDSMVHVVPEPHPPAPPVLAGFPTRRIKLRGDMLAAFPQFRPYVRTELVRNETKYVVDLAQIDPQYCLSEAVSAGAVTLCLLERQEKSETSWHPASADAVWAAVMQNSLFYDNWPVWERNLAGIERLLDGAGAYHLRIGRDPSAMLNAVESLWQASAGG